MKRKLEFLLVVLLVVFVGACGSAAAPAPSRSTQPGPGQPPPSSETGADYRGVPAPGAPEKPESKTTTASATDRLIVRTANLSLTVKDAEAALETAKSTASSLGGFISNSQTVRVDKDRVRVSVTIRVPAEKFDEAIKQLKQAAIRVESEKLAGQDVTEEYIDLSARLRNLEATEKELLALMTTVREKTNRAEEILAVQRELNNVRQQIEQLKGRMQYLERSVALATITLDLIPESLEAPVAPEGWDPARVARDALRALVNTLQALATVGIYLVIYLLPVLVIIGVPLGVLVRLLRRGRGTKQVVAS